MFHFWRRAGIASKSERALLCLLKCAVKIVEAATSKPVNGADSLESEIVDENCYMQSIQPGIEMASTVPKAGRDQSLLLTRCIRVQARRYVEVLSGSCYSRTEM